MTRPLLNYPRRTVRIAIEYVRRNAAAMLNRAEYDEIIILRAGKPCLVMVHHDYFRLLQERAGLLNKAKRVAQRAVPVGKRRPIAKRRPLSD